MKHVRLFENFDKLNESESKEIIFDWIPFDSQADNPANASMPSELSYDQLLEYRKENPNDGSDKLGLYIAHHKLNDGFLRLISGYENPLVFNVAKFDNEFKKVDENDIDSSKFDLNTYVRGSGILSRFSGF